MAVAAHPRLGRRVKIREAAFEDYAQIVALQARHGLPTRPFAEWIDQWTGNPAYQTVAGEWTIGWVLENDAGEVVGSIGNIPLAYRLGGRPVRAAGPCAWTVDPAYRGYSVAILQRLTAQPNVDLLISRASPMSEPAFRLLQWTHPPAGSWDSSAIWITNYRRFAQSAARVKRLRLPAPLRYAAAGALCFRDQIVRTLVRRAERGYDIELCDFFDEQFDEFWQELQRDKPNMLLAVRSKETLGWHFRSSLARKDAWILRASRNGRMAAYAVFDRADNEAYAIKRARLVDSQCLSGSEAALALVIREMIALCRRHGIDAVEDPGCCLDRLVCERHIPRPVYRRLPCWLYHCKVNPEWLAIALRESQWAPSTFDGTASL